MLKVFGLWDPSQPQSQFPIPSMGEYGHFLEPCKWISKLQYGLFSQVRWYFNCPPFLPVWITYLHQRFYMKSRVQMSSLGSLLEKAAKRFSAVSFLELVFWRAWAIYSSELLGKVSFKASIALASIVKCNQHKHLRSIVTSNPGCMLDHFTKELTIIF